MKLESFDASITEKDVQEFEKAVGVESLPTEYRQFLLEHNGGYVDEVDAFKFHGSEDGSNVEGFYGLNLEGDSSFNHEWNISCYRERNRIPREFLAIAHDAFGNQICLGIAGNHVGEIYFWDHEEETHEWEEPTMDNMILVAKTFTDFINGLYKFELEDNSE